MKYYVSLSIFLFFFSCSSYVKNIHENFARVDVKSNKKRKPANMRWKQVYSAPAVASSSKNLFFLKMLSKKDIGKKTLLIIPKREACGLGVAV